MDCVQVFRSDWASKERAGPFVGVRDDSLLAYTLLLPKEFTAWPGRELTETVLVDLDLGVNMSVPCWQWYQAPNGDRVSGVDAELTQPSTWYVDLVSIRVDADRIEVVDLFIDIMIATDGRQARMLDLDEFGDALDAGLLTSAEAADALRRWQRFLDTYVYPARDPRHEFAEFPPTRFTHLVAALNECG